MAVAIDEQPLAWAEISEEKRQRYREKLSGLWGHEGDEGAYNALTRDKQEALDLLSGRLIDDRSMASCRPNRQCLRARRRRDVLQRRVRP